MPEDLNRPPQRDEDGSIRLRVRLPAELADLVERAVGGGSVTGYVCDVLWAAASRGAARDDVPGTPVARSTPRPSQRVYTIEQAADALGISRSTLLREVQAGRVAIVKFGRRVGLTDAQIDALVEAHIERPSAQPVNGRPRRRL